MGDIVGAFKSLTTVEYIRGVKTHGWPPFRGRFWQRNYYEHIVRTERAMNAIRRYIVENPLRWHFDRYNPNATGTDPMARELWWMLQDDARKSRAQTTRGVDPPIRR